MAAGILPAPGTKNYYGEDIGPCAGECKHKDCARTRAMAGSTCRLCGKPIGYGVRFYDESEPGSDALVHQACREGWQPSDEEGGR